MARRIIDQLRKLYPDSKWRYDARQRQWYGDSFHVFGESHDYDDSSGYHTVRYVKSEPYGEVINEILPRREYCG